MSLLTTVGTNVDKILTLAAFLYFTLPEGVMGTSFKTCPTCGLVDYSGLMGTDDCYTKMMVSTFFTDHSKSALNHVILSL